MTFPRLTVDHLRAVLRGPGEIPVLYVERESSEPELIVRDQAYVPHFDIVISKHELMSAFGETSELEITDDELAGAIKDRSLQGRVEEICESDRRDSPATATITLTDIAEQVGASVSANGGEHAEGVDVLAVAGEIRDTYGLIDIDATDGDGEPLIPALTYEAIIAKHDSSLRIDSAEDWADVLNSETKRTGRSARDLASNGLLCGIVLNPEHPDAEHDVLVGDAPTGGLWTIEYRAEDGGWSAR